MPARNRWNWSADGALLVTGYASVFGPLPAMRVNQIGYGAGALDLRHAERHARVCRGSRWRNRRPTRVVVIEAEVDDMNPQFFGGLIDTCWRPGPSMRSTRRST